MVVPYESEKCWFYTTVDFKQNRQAKIEVATLPDTSVSR
jgi:hypothetical protein